jgi:hypothetical protein
LTKRERAELQKMRLEIGKPLTKKDIAQAERLGWELTEHARTGERPKPGEWAKEKAKRKHATLLSGKGRDKN